MNVIGRCVHGRDPHPIVVPFLPVRRVVAGAEAEADRGKAVPIAVDANRTVNDAADTYATARASAINTSRSNKRTFVFLKRRLKCCTEHAPRNSISRRTNPLAKAKSVRFSRDARDRIATSKEEANEDLAKEKMRAHIAFLMGKHGIGPRVEKSWLCEYDANGEIVFGHGEARREIPRQHPQKFSRKETYW